MIVSFEGDVEGQADANSGAGRGGFAIAFIVLGALFFAVRSSSWLGSKEIHTLMESTSTLMAAVVGVLALLRFHARRDMVVLLIGTGFFGTAMLDGYHAVVTSQWFDQLLPSPPPHLIPWSWNASRTFLSAMMLLSWWVWHEEHQSGRRTRLNEWTVYGVSVGLTLASFIFFAFAPLPRAYYPELPLGRPEELVSAALFAAALVGYLDKGKWRTDPFERGIVLSLIVGVASQAAFMPLSFGLFDAMFDAAHLLKTVGYVCVLVGLLQSVRMVFASERDSSARLEAIFDAVPEGLAIVGDDGTLEKTNPALHQLLGYEPGELDERPIHVLIPDALDSQYASDPEKPVTHLLDHVSLEQRQIVARHQSGDQIPVAINLVPLNASGGHGVLALFHDLRERLRAESDMREHAEALARSNSELDDFAHVVSHDLKEPLRGIRNYSGFLLEDYGETLDEEGRTKLEALPRLTARLEKLLDSLLHYSRVGRTELSVETTDLQALVEDVVDSIHVSLEEADVEIRIPDSLPTRVCDPVRVAEIFRNLLTNAMKYNDKDEKWIEVGFDSGSNDGVFYVRDNGIGIREKHLDSVFRIFKRLHARDAFGGGTGSGLTIVKKLVERHGGTIQVESVFREGSTFKFSLAEPEVHGSEEKEE